MSITQIQYSLVSSGDDSFVTAFVPGEPAPLVAAKSGHPNFEAIVAALMSDTPATEIVGLFDITKAVAEKFDRLSERVTVGNGRVYFDGDEVRSSVATQIVRFLDEGHGFAPLVSFMENIAANPTDHSREQLFDWLDNREGITINQDGLIVGYKGVHKDGDELVSGYSGSAIVDGVSVRGHIPNAIGTTVEMPRSAVAHDPSSACSAGLHVGTFRYAQSYARGAMLKVLVNPRDVVSVPTDAAGEKIRVCRYQVVEVIDAPETSALVFDEDWDALVGALARRWDDFDDF